MPKNEDGTPIISPVAEIPPLSYMELINTPNCQITAFKRSERDPKKYVIRLAEQRGSECMALLQLNTQHF